MSTFDLIIRPVITEKATKNEAQGKYQFLVRNHATKIEIKSMFKKLYGVDVSKINVMRTAGKTKMGKTRRPVKKKAEFKKVVITTKGKKTIDIAKPKVKV